MSVPARWPKRSAADASTDGLIIETSGAYDEVVKILAPLTTPDDVLDYGLDILESAIHATVVAHSAAAE